MSLIPSPRFYILKAGKIVPVTISECAKWLGTNERIIAHETIGQNKVSTIFLGLDHNFADKGPPILWETMTFGAKLDQEQKRCAGSYEQAQAMHEQMVREVCEAYGIPYDPDRTRIIDREVERRLFERVQHRVEERLKKMKKRSGAARMNEIEGMDK
jgi:hypothetical protein